MSRFRTWFRKGLTFKCTQCGACCAAPENAVWINPHEAAKLAAGLELDAAAFLQRYVEDPSGQKGKWLLKKGSRGECVFLTKERRCGVYKDRPTQCRTYPFWPEHLISPLDWNAEALMRCEGMRAVPLRDLPEGDIKEEAAVKDMLRTDLQREGLDFTEDAMEGLLTETEMDVIEDYGKEFWKTNYRRVRHETERLLVVDTCLGGSSLKRSLIAKSMPAHVQSEIALQEKEGQLCVRHDRLLQRPYQGMLVALLPYVGRNLAETDGRWRFGMIGAGCGALVNYLQCLGDSVPSLVSAVDVDPQVLYIGKDWFGFDETDTIQIVCQDGLEFLQEAPDGAYDLLFVDVASVSSLTAVDGVAESPPAAFYSSDAVELLKSKLKRHGTVIVNIVGDLPKLHAVHKSLSSRFPHISAIHVPEATVLFASATPVSLQPSATELSRKNVFPDDSLRQLLNCVNAYHERYHHLSFGWLDQAALTKDVVS